ncbi:hypothetical protein MKW92_048340 [Papaver armeniacum]|nr:hypothetical protein MKW92_048340 [Papaver armeniacum]
MDLTGPIHDFILEGLCVKFSTQTFLFFRDGGTTSLFHIPSNSHFVAAAQLLIYVGAINVLIIFVVVSNQILEQDLINKGQQIGIHLSTDFFSSFDLYGIVELKFRASERHI